MRRISLCCCTYRVLFSLRSPSSCPEPRNPNSLWSCREARTIQTTIPFHSIHLPAKYSILYTTLHPFTLQSFRLKTAFSAHCTLYMQSAVFYGLLRMPEHNNIATRSDIILKAYTTFSTQLRSDQAKNKHHPHRIWKPRLYSKSNVRSKATLDVSSSQSPTIQYSKHSTRYTLFLRAMTMCFALAAA